jgi:hypothetical protein
MAIVIRRSQLTLAALCIILSLTFIGCDLPNPGDASRSTVLQTPLPTNTVAIPTYTPATPTDCGFVHYGPPGLSPANYEELIGCFVERFRGCRSVHFVYEFFSATDQGHNELSLSGTAESCMIHVQEHYTSTAKSPPIDTNYTYTCSRLELRDGHYVVTGCDNHFEINFP